VASLTPFSTTQRSRIRRVLVTALIALAFASRTVFAQAPSAEDTLLKDSGRWVIIAKSFNSAPQ